MAIRRVTVNGRKVWQARVAFRGARTSRLCASREEARHVEAELLGTLKAKVGAAEAADQAPATVRQLFAAYADDLEARGKHADAMQRVRMTERAVETACPAWLDRLVSEVSDRDLFDFRRARERAGRKPATINRDLNTLRAMLKRVRPEYRFPSGIRFREDDTRVRWLRPEEEILTLEPMRSPFREMAKLAALTLMRQGELRLLRQEQVHLEQGVVLLPRPKTEPRAVILSAAAQKLLRDQLERHPGSEWVFPKAADGRPYSRNRVGEMFRQAARGAGLRDFHFHDLRHHGATMALNAGFSAPIVMALGGWKSERTMRRYAAVTDQTLRRAAEAVSGNEAWQVRGNPAAVQA